MARFGYQIDKIDLVAIGVLAIFRCRIGMYVGLHGFHHGILGLLDFLEEGVIFPDPIEDVAVYHE